MKTEHKYAQALRWIADGEKVEARYKDKRFGCFPSDFDNSYVGRMLEGDDGWEFSLKPRTITVNGREVQAGETVAPEAEFFFVDLHSTDLWGKTFWCGTPRDKLKLERGLVHLTPEAAIAHAKAMLNID